jgi:mannosyltransferase PIG-V
VPESSSLPRWARALDFLCLAFVLLGLTVALSGGFRVRLFDARVAVTSPYRMLVWAAIVAVVRHLALPRPPIYADLPARVLAAWNTNAVRTSLAALVSTRAGIMFVGYMAIFLIGYPNIRAPWRVSGNEFGNLPARWDVGWYLGVAIDGYSFSPQVQAKAGQQNIVFFPAMPLLTRVAGRLFGGSPLAYTWGGVLVSLIAFLAGLAYLFRLARDLLASETLAAYVVWLVAAYPFSLFYGVPYTESLFLLGSAGAFYHFLRGESWKGGAWGLLVGLTRPNGCFLSVPLALIALEPWLPAWLVGGHRAADPARLQQRTPARLVASIAAASLPGIGVLLYSAYIWSLTGHPLSWAEGHIAWGRSYQGLWILVAERYQYLSEAGVYNYTSQGSADFIQLIGVVFALIPVWPVARRFGLAFAVFILINMLPPLAAGGLLSAGRFSSVLFPAFIWFGSVVPERQRPGWIAAFMALQALNATMFYTWRQLY